MLAYITLLFSLTSPVSGLTSLEEWDNFANNFATDLAPVLVLFGEQASKQFLSESTSIWDNVLFGIAPIGVLTAVISAIRLCGGTSLKAFVGRAQEAHGQAEAELCSSTSEDVCELWSNGGICRVFGRPKILEFCYLPGKRVFYPALKEQITILPSSCGIYLAKDLFGAHNQATESQEQKEDSDDGSDWTEDNPRSRDSSQMNALEKARPNFAPHPNLSLNIGIRAVPQSVLPLIVMLGVCLQLSFFGYATWATFYSPGLYEDGKRPKVWSFSLATAGTALLVMGVILCALLIERMSTERKFTKSGSKSRMFWLQPGGQRVGDQLFNAFAYSAEKDVFVTSWKEGPDMFPKATLSLILWIALASSVGGFVCQFVGFRGLHGSVALYQLAVTLCMAIVRSFLRSRRLGVDKNALKDRTDIEEHELDWQALNIEEPHKEASNGWFIIDYPKALTKPDIVVDSGIQDLTGQQVAGFGVQRHQDISPDRFAQQAVEWASYNEAVGSLPNDAARLMHYRSRLAYLTGDIIQKPDQIWDTEVRRTARQLQLAIQESAEYIFSTMALSKEWNDARALTWSTTCHLQQLPTGPRTHCVASSPALPINFVMHRNGGVWEIGKCQLEAILGLWYWSLKKMADPNHLFKRKIFMLDKRSKRNDIVSAIRLWVTQTHQIHEEDADPLPGPKNPPDTQQPVPTSKTQPNQLVPANHVPYSTTLSVPLRTLLGMTPAENPQSSELCLSIPTKSSLLQLIAQDVFTIFITRIATIMERLDHVEPWTGQGQTTTVGIVERSSEGPYRGLTNSHIQTIANICVSSQLFSREDALASIIPPLLQRSKLPGVDNVTETLLSAAKTFRRNGKFDQCETLLKWLLGSIPPRYRERIARGLGELYRKAILSPEESERQFVRKCFAALAAANTPLENSTIQQEAQRAIDDSRIQQETQRTIDDYKIALDYLEDVSRPSGKQISDIENVLSDLDSAPPKLLGLTLSHDFNLTKTSVGDAFRILEWAIRRNCSGLIEDLWKGAKDLVNKRDNEGRPSLFWAIKWNCEVETLQALLDWPGLEIDLRDFEGKTPLISASESGNKTIVDLLLRHGANIQIMDKTGQTPLLAAVNNRQECVLRRLLTAGADVRARGPTTALHGAIHWKLEIVELLLKYRADVELVDSSNRTPLRLATEKNDLETVDLLLRYGADIKAKHDGSTVLQFAVWKGYEAVAHRLLEDGADANMYDQNSNTALHLATTSGNAKLVEDLLKHGANTELRDTEDRTALLISLNRGHEVVAEQLLLLGNANPNACGGLRGSRPLHLAAHSGNEKMVRLLLDRKADVGLGDKTGQQPLIVAVKENREKIVPLLLDAKGADADAQDEDGVPVLHLAIQHRNLPIVGHLLDHGVDKEAEDSNGRKALVLALEIERASARHRPSMVERLLQAGANANTQWKDNGSALHVAAQGDNTTAVELLLSYGAEKDALDPQGRTPLLIAAESEEGGMRYQEVVKCLIRAKSDPNAQGGRYGNALQAASYRGQGGVVEQLILAGANVNAEGGVYGNALQAAVTAWSAEEVVEQLLRAGTDVNALGGKYRNALHAALHHGRKRALKLLLEHGADPELENDEGQTALMAAVGNDNKKAVKQLLDHKAATESKDRMGRTTLLVAVGKGDEALVRLLLDHGAGTESKDTQGRTPLLLAVEKGHIGILKRLLEAKADVTVEGGLYGNALQAALYTGDAAIEMKLREAGALRQSQYSDFN